MSAVFLFFFFILCTKEPTLRVSSSSSCHAASTDFPDPRSPPFSIVHRSQEVFQAKSCIGTELLYEVLAGHHTFARPCEWVHRCTSLTSSSLLKQQCPACLVRLTWMVFVMRCIAAVLWGAASMTSSIQLAEFLCSWRQAFSPYAQLPSMWCIHTAVLI